MRKGKVLSYEEFRYAAGQGSRMLWWQCPAGPQHLGHYVGLMRPLSRVACEARGVENILMLTDVVPAMLAEEHGRLAQEIARIQERPTEEVLGTLLCVPNFRKAREFAVCMVKNMLHARVVTSAVMVAAVSDVPELISFAQFCAELVTEEEIREVFGPQVPVVPAADTLAASILVCLGVDYTPVGGHPDDLAVARLAQLVAEKVNEAVGKQVVQGPMPVRILEGPLCGLNGRPMRWGDGTLDLTASEEEVWQAVKGAADEVVREWARALEVEFEVATPDSMRRDMARLLSGLTAEFRRAQAEVSDVDAEQVLEEGAALVRQVAATTLKRVEEAELSRGRLAAVGRER